MDAIAFIWKTLRTKVSIKPLVLSMSFDCFLSGLGRLCGLPAPSLCVVSPAARGVEGAIHKFCLWAGSPNPTAALLPTRAVLIFPG